MNNLIYIRKSVEMSIFDTLCGKLTNEQIDIINSILNEQKEIIFFAFIIFLPIFIYSANK